MTVYHRIQKAIDYSENTPDIRENSDVQAAAEACMSLRNFHRLFSALTGLSYKQYARKRILAASLEMLSAGKQNVLEISLECGYESPEAYSRAFRKEFSMLPSEYQKKPGNPDILHEINLLEESYMELAVKQLKDMRVAYYRTISETPEDNAWKVFSEWAEKYGLFKKPFRIFGYDNPIPNPKEDYKYNDPELGKHTVTKRFYGYEFFMPVDESVKGDSRVKIKTIPGGKFAVYGASRSDGNDWIPKSWQKMMKILKGTHYKPKICPELPFYGHMARWYEEHLDFYPDPDNLRLDLYLEIE